MKTFLFKLGFFSWFIVYSCALLAQTDPSIDSLKKTLLTAPNDTNKVYVYSSIAYSYQWSDPDSALLYALPGLALARNLNFEIGEYNLLLPITEALSLKGNYSKALEYRFRGVELANRLKNPATIANSLALTGLVYKRSKDYDKALEYFYKAQKMNVVTLGGPQFIKGFIGETYFDLHKSDSALLYIQTAYDLDTRDTELHWSDPYRYLAALFEQKGNHVKAIDLYRQSLAFGHGNNDILEGYIGIAGVYKNTGQTDSAIFYLRQAISLGTTASILAPVIEAGGLLVEVYKSLYNIDSAFRYQNIVLAYKDSLFSQEKIKQLQNVTYNEQMRQQEIINEKDRYENRVKQYALLAALAVFITIGFILWKNNKTKQSANALLSKKNEEVEHALNKLKSTQAQLIQSEKMASLGELTAGIAHEIQNPLNFVNNFSEVNGELIKELKREASSGNIAEVTAIADDIETNSEKINHHGKRADAIVKGMLQHSRTSSGQKEPTDINKIVDEYLRLAYQGFRARDKSFNATIVTQFDANVGNISIIPQGIGRVFLNLINNAFYAVSEKQKQNLSGYEPTVTVSTARLNDKVEIKVQDNGNGIPSAIKEKIFHPFFTTKPTGQGTGLGLSLAYDIVKAHGGEIKVETEEPKGSAFIVQLPVT